MSMPESDSAATRPGPWYEGITITQWMVLAIASAGWIFDVYEAQLFTIFKGFMFKELLGDSTVAADWHTQLGFALFLLGGATGGLFFGILGDRMGRVRVMSLTILTYSAFSALTYFAQSMWQVDVLRFLVALGTGGEWAIAAALVAETFPIRARAIASGIFHASSVLGVALASGTGMVLNQPNQWRYGFLVGLAPALLILWIRMSLREPERWQAAKQEVEGEMASAPSPTPDKHPASGHELGSLSELLGDPRWRFRALLGLALASVGLATYWGIFALGPDLAREVIGKSVSAAQKQTAASWAYLLMNFTGGLFGLLAFAPLASWKGRRFAFVVYHLGALVTVPITFLGAQTYTQALWLLPTMAFFVVGMHAGYAIYFPELFPTRLRATGSSFCFNLGRILGAVILLVRGELRAWLGLRHAVVAVSSLFLVGLVLLAFAPETRGQNLPE
jgi:predicted MFS family arabinose efflux permease